MGKDKASIFGLRRGADQDLRPAAAAPPAASYLGDAALRLNARALASFAAAQFLDQNPSVPLLQSAGLSCRPPVMQDIASPWLAYWANELGLQPRAHRKLWEYAVVLQALHEAGILRPGARALGFGVGDEPLPSYLASLGMEVVASDMIGITDRDAIFQERFLTEAEFDARIEVSDIDFAKLGDPSLRNFDACWSCSVVGVLGAEHIAEEALIKSMDVLRPGGVAVHLMEFAFAPDTPKERNDIFFPRSFFEGLERAMNGRGHIMAPVSFDLGSHPLDAYVDIQDLGAEDSVALEALWSSAPSALHLKVGLGEVMTTSFAVIVTCRS